MTLIGKAVNTTQSFSYSKEKHDWFNIPNKKGNEEPLKLYLFYA